MKERPILFSGPMVRAILDGSKTQTRRTFKGTTEHKGPYNPAYMEAHQQANGWGSICPHGTPGDRLWVRETWAVQHGFDAWTPRHIPRGARIYYSATADLKGPCGVGGLRCRPSIFMPRWASRILLEITDVRVQRLQEISEGDARAEGVSDGGCLSCGNPEPCGCGNPQPDARDGFAWLWQSINGPGSWHANPWVWAITFQRLEP
jgi:hypothetical protein